MSEYKKEDVNVMPTYAGFLTARLIDIWWAWDHDDPEFALSRSLRLFYFLPTEVKKKLRGDKEQILKELQGVTVNKNLGWFSGQLDRNRRVKTVAMRYLPEYLDKMVDLLDERGYLEKPRILRLQKEHFKEFENEGKMD